MVAGALLVEGAIGWPRRLSHPVVWIGGLIARLERRWNRPEQSAKTRRALGVLTVLILLCVAGGAGWGIERLAAAAPFWPGLALLLIWGATGLAARSLFEHVRAVSRPLTAGDLSAARCAVGMIVGRDVEAMDEGEVATAALESLAESFCDGVVAPAFWFVVGGLPGLFAYKAVNTADSMIGHMEPRWRAFGWAAARTDDAMNWIPARIAGALIALGGWQGWRIMWRDARKHASPNAGWTEAAMAGALRVRLGGPVRYEGVMTYRPDFGDWARPRAHDLQRGLRVYGVACAVLLISLIAGGFAWPR
ncbi:cobalamin biosynthesis protein CobD [Brevundimonas sp. MYb46]|nr:cobalamin biosynthesis protein CobD [Brevundimonas sp. MYb31]PRA25875.1 cobalamin biosynthesis protein CobD [Brevundimonas sp. MYb27]PRB18122.1 cobalamin biosynthesis protein CobD [Brevundimonas sp. MYb52]PRB36054.1 cobalamin biosynthesis protein CobD [Brevundimonas sp. MYb46]PRB49395.1 cobalamin biosynthesis protein CobD [Brevundimonas sp. MYb33]